MNRVFSGAIALVCLSWGLSFAGPAVSDRVLIITESSQRLLNSESNSLLVSRYYGLEISTEAVNTLDSVFYKDPGGSFYPLIVISDYALELADSSLAGAFKTFLNDGGVLFVQDIYDDQRENGHEVLAYLTGGSITGADSLSETQKSLVFSSVYPKFTGVFTGQAFSYAEPGDDQALVFAPGPPQSVVPIVQGFSTSSNFYLTYFACDTVGSGIVFASSASSSHAWAALENSYNTQYASEVLPLMMTEKYIYGDGAWHSPTTFANLTIDDPALANGDVDFSDLLDQIEQHRYHLTIAYIPENFILHYDQPPVEKLFASNPTYLSVVQHGDYHNGYEFFVYTSQDSAMISAKRQALSGLTPVPIKEQERKIVDGATKLYFMEKYVGLPQTRVMVFPDGISPEPTLELLRQYNYNSSCNAQNTPLLDAHSDPSWDAWMRPSDMIYGSHPLLVRRQPYSVDSTRSGSQYAWGVFDLFAGIPALYYSHLGELFPPVTNFNTFADSLNALAVPPTWASLNYISTHLYLLKTNSDGSDSLWAFGNTINVQSSTSMLVHIMKQESSNPNLIRALVNGSSVPFYYSNGYIYLDLSLPAGTTTKIEFLYQHLYTHFSLGDSFLSTSGDSLYVWVSNSGDSDGVCPVAVLDSTRDSLVAVSTQWVNAHDSTLYAFPAPANSEDSTWVILDPAGIVQYPSGELDRHSILGAAVSSSSNIPDKFSISQNYPNPFNPTTVIKYQVPTQSHVTIRVFDVLGREVAVLLDHEMEPGSYSIFFNGSRFASGVYFCQMQATTANGMSFNSTKKMVLMK